MLWRRGGRRGGALRAVWGRILGRGGYSIVRMEMLGGRGRGVERTCFDIRAMQDIRGGWDMVRRVVDRCRIGTTREDRRPSTRTQHTVLLYILIHLRYSSDKVTRQFKS